jgi:peptide/nickel transport system ATP-binding protein
MTSPLLSVDGLHVRFRTRGWRKPPFHALRGVSLTIDAGETLGLVGESGSGKTTLGRAVLGLVKCDAGGILYDGADITHLRGRERRRLSDQIQVVFQDPYTSLNPTMLVGDILAEPLLVHGVSRAEATARIAELLAAVKLPSDAAGRLAREFSGGQRQRVAIARALALRPRLIVCDEPVSALDLSTQARVLDLLLEIQGRTGVALLFISHDLSVVRHISHRVTVMRHGEIVETGSAEIVTTHPVHPYTQRLLMAAPVPDPKRQAARRAARLALAADDAA